MYSGKTYIPNTIVRVFINLNIIGHYYGKTIFIKQEKKGAVRLCAPIYVEKTSSKFTEKRYPA